MALPSPEEIQAMIDQEGSGLPSPNEVDAMIAQEPSGAIPVVRNALQGLTFGFGDEAVAATDATFNSIGNLVGLGDGSSWSDKYDNRLDFERDQLEAYRDANPYLSLATEIAGGLPLLPFGGSGQASAARSLLMRALSSAPKAAVPAFAYGYGTGEGGVEGRFRSGGEAGLAAALLGPTFVVGGDAIGRIAKSGPVRDSMGGLVSKLSKATPSLGDEAGALLVSGGDDALDPVAQAVLKATRQVDPEDFMRANQKLQREVAGGAPMNLVDALDNALVDRKARYYRNSPGGATVVDEFLDARTAGAEGRITEALKTVSPEASVMEGAAKASKAAKNVLEKAKSDRSRIANRFYEKAFQGGKTIDDAQLADILEIGVVKKAMKQVRNLKDSKFNELPDNDIRVLDQLKQQIDAMINLSDEKQTAGLLDIKSKMLRILDREVPEYKQARKVFEDLSPLINELKGSKKNSTRGVLTGLLTADDRQLVNGVKRMMALEPEDISKARDAFGDQYKDEFRAGVRAFIQDQLEGMNFGIGNESNVNIAKKLMGSTSKQKKLKAALGVKTTKELKELLEREAAFHRTTQKTYTGSSTATNLAEASTEAKNLSGYLKSPLKKGGGAIVDYLTAPSESEALQRRIAEALFLPDSSAEYMEKLLPVIQGRGTYDAAVSETLEPFLNYAQSSGNVGRLAGALKGRSE